MKIYTYDELDNMSAAEIKKLIPGWALPFYPGYKKVKADNWVFFINDNPDFVFNIRIGQPMFLMA